MKNLIMETNYTQLMLRAEQASSRKEAIDLINLATRLLEHEELKKVEALYKN